MLAVLCLLVWTNKSIFECTQLHNFMQNFGPIGPQQAYNPGHSDCLICTACPALYAWRRSYGTETVHEVMKLGVLKDWFDYLFANTLVQQVGIGWLSSMSMRTMLGIGRLRGWGFLHLTCDNVVIVCITVTGFTFQDNLNRTVHNYINSDLPLLL